MYYSNLNLYNNKISMIDFETILEYNKMKNNKLDKIFRNLEIYQITTQLSLFQNNLFIIFKLIKKLNIKNLFKKTNNIIKNNTASFYLLRKKIIYQNFNKNLIFFNNYFISSFNSLIVPHSFINNQHIVIKKYGTLKFLKYSHYDMIKKLKIVDLHTSKQSIGDRGYFLIREGVDLNLSLIMYGFKFLTFFNYFKVWSPCFVKKSLLKKCVQLSDFEEQLYKIKEKITDKFLIATSEQSLCAKMENTIHNLSHLPRKLVCYSECFRKEVGSHGKDTKGIFRVHQFEKIEQFIVSQPNKYNSTNNFLNLLEITEKFYKLFQIPYQIILLTTSDINFVSYIKFDIEAWFSGSKTFRELVSCSNCKNYQSINLNIETSFKKKKFKPTDTFNSTLIATERFICNMLENYQTPFGLKIPKNLKQFLKNLDLINYKIFF
ncbi:seryl-tRNA synthetase (serin-tRNA ligase) (nucleomorph) [Lotharella oceanica]|uniref:serine--tRNA ligase n=1 Tax=Lotharella oceanica TaxID=641309 RepID=A0A060DAS4_9EUKA|nr:seryl-tRNA synthetase (serin-tRNA ligase) [Lotharella oceanica]